MKRLLIVLALACASRCNAQPAAVPSLEIGMSRSRALAHLGAPASYYFRGRHYRFPPEPPSYVEGLLWEVYERRAGRVSYEARVLYGIDPEGPRLHPALQVEEVQFAFDRPITAREMLAIVPEVRRACSQGCEVLQVDVPEAGGSHIKVRPLHRGANDPTFELAWFSITGGEEQGVSTMDDEVTELHMYSRSLDRAGESLDEPSRALGYWPPK